MSKYGDTTFQTLNEISAVTKESPLQQTETNFNLMFSLGVLKDNGSFKIIDKSEGYLDVNLYQGTQEANGNKIVYDLQKTAVHKCNQDDRRHFYDESD